MSVNKSGKKEGHLFIGSENTWEDVLQQCDSSGFFADLPAFVRWAERQGLNKALKPGHYLLQPGMSNREIVNILLSGRQTPVRVTFNNMRTLPDLTIRLSQQLDINKDSLQLFFDTTDLFQKAGISKDERMTVFIPNTYEFYWTVSEADLTGRLIKEHDIFWNAARRSRAEAMGLTPAEVYILASIVYSENEKAVDEAPRIAGVYMNRLQKNMKLEADPTVKFALGDFSIKRILFADLEIDSPYNTYKYFGLPPGPIHMPPVSYIDAVLNYEEHAYIFMCARGDGSGYHYFAKTLAEHNRNRQLYIQTLNKQGIKR